MDDWRKFFDEQPASADPSKPRMAGARLHKATIHQSLHSLSSRLAVYTRAWLMLLPRLGVEREGAKGRVVVVRALNVMRRGEQPHWTRSLLVMDSVGCAADYGTPFSPNDTMAVFDRRRRQCTALQAKYQVRRSLRLLTSRLV